jgi:hypothetical protein
MKSVILVVVVGFSLVGCANTYENRQAWEAIGLGLQGAGNGLYQGAAELRHNSMRSHTPYQPPQRCSMHKDGNGNWYNVCF